MANQLGANLDQSLAGYREFLEARVDQCLSDMLRKEGAPSANGTSKQDGARCSDAIDDNTLHSPLLPNFRHYVPSREQASLERRASDIPEYHEETTESHSSGHMKKHTVTRRSTTPRTTQNSPVHISLGGFDRSITPPFTIKPPLLERYDLHRGFSDPLISTSCNNHETVTTPIGA